MAGIFGSKLTTAVRNYLEGIDLQGLCRIDASRLASRAIPNIGSIEFVDSEKFDNKYNALYMKEFPNCAERERSDLISSRLAAQSAGERSGLAPYRIIGIKDSRDEAIGAAHFTVLPLKGGKFAVPYLQYIYVRSENRRQDMSEVLHTLMLAATVADARQMNNRSVPFTLFEMEPPGYGNDEESRAFSTIRAQVHTKGGAVAIVLERDGEEISPHVQPGLEMGDRPLSLMWALRPSPVEGGKWRIEDLGGNLVAAYYQSLRDEGFLEKNIRLAESMVEEKCRGSEWRLIPLDQVKFHFA